MGKRSAAGLLTSVDSIFTTQEERDNAQRSYVTDLPAAEISDFPNHPFKVRMDQSMVELAESVKLRRRLSGGSRHRAGLYHLLRVRQFPACC